jgi:hypothetical protein
LLTNTLMRTILIVVSYVLPDDPLYMPAIMEENVIQAFSTQTADKPFANPIGLWRSIRRHQFLDP